MLIHTYACTYVHTHVHAHMHAHWVRIATIAGDIGTATEYGYGRTSFSTKSLEWINLSESIN